MPRLPRLSARETIRALERLGLVQIRQRGSHVVLQRGKNTCTVPLHRELKVGTLAGNLVQAGISVDQLMGAMK